HMAAEGRRPALHDGARGFADVRGEGMGLCVGRKVLLEDRLQSHEGHRGLRTRERSKVGWVSLQYHANYPRDKRLVQELLSVPQASTLTLSMIWSRPPTQGSGNPGLSLLGR